MEPDGIFKFLWVNWPNEKTGRGQKVARAWPEGYPSLGIL